jgi:PAS domain S-box-containing protein
MTRKRAAAARGTAPPGLRARLAEAEATLEAIRTGEVDALVVAGPRGTRTLAIEGATDPYHVLLNAMTDGAVLLTTDGTILFGNRRFGEIARAPLAGLIGSHFPRLLPHDQRAAVEALLNGESGQKRSGEFSITRGGAPTTAVWLSFSTVPLDADPAHEAAVRMAIVTDLTERKQGEQARLELMKRLITIEDEERRRIARELHDETGQSLTALLVGLRVIEQQTEKPEVSAVAHRLRKIAAETVDNVGRLARGLHPSVLDDLGLLAAARRYVTDYAKAFALVVDLRSVGVGSQLLPSLVQTTIYRILQEGLTNIARHAEARTVDIELKLEDGTLALLIRDDGVGFDPAAVGGESSGLGLHGMGERTALLGGSLEIRSAPGQGTTVRAWVPVTGLRRSEEG